MASSKRPKKRTSKSTRATKKRRAIFATRHAYDDDAHPLHAYLDAFNGESRRTLAACLESIADILSDGKVKADRLAWHRIRSQHTHALRSRMQRIFAPSTTNRYLTALRGILKTSWRLDLLDRETMEQTMDVSPARGKRALRGRAVSVDELVALFGACSNDANEPLGARDAAILAVLYGAGLRRAEVAAAATENLDTAQARLRVIGKGNKERAVYLPPGTLAAVLAWLEYRGESAGPLFTQVRKTGAVTADGITAQLVYHVVQRRHLEAGIEPFTPHDMRRSHISQLLDDGVDLATVARQVGHSNVQTTARYDRRDDAAQQRGVLGLEVPFPK